MSRIAADFRYATRVVLKNPRFSMVAVAALALGIGANAAIFSVVNGVLLQPLPYPEPERLVRVCRQFPGGLGCSASIPKFNYWRRARSFEAIAAYDFTGPGLNLGSRDRPEQIKGIHVSSDYFRVFGAAVQLGRTFTPDEDRPGGPRVAVLSHGLWASRFGSDPRITERPVLLNGESYTVLGVLQAGFRPDPPSDVFIPLQADPNSTNQGHFLSVGSRLAPGTTLASARAELKLIGDEFRRANPRWMSNDEQATAERMQDIMVRDVRPALLILLGAVGLVLLIACANVANLLLARAAGRQKEVAVRAAIGASRMEIVRQLLVESLLLAAVGAALGVLLGVSGARALVALSPGNLPRADDLAQAPLIGTLLDGRLLAFTLGVTLLTAILFGIAPALHLSRPDLGNTLKEGGGRGSSGARASRTRGLLVVVEMALALVLLVGATLLIRTFMQLRSLQPGFQTENVITLQTSLAGSKYSTTAQVDALAREVTQRLEGLPGVQAAAMTIMLPPEGSPDLPFRIEGRELKGDSQFHGDEDWLCVSPQYFKALSIPLLRGRVFDLRDTGTSAKVVIVSAAFAKKYWPDGDAIGQQITIGKGLGPEFEDPTREIVGVVGDVRQNGLGQPPPPIMYVPGAQVSDSLTRLGNNILPFTWLVRASANPMSLSGPIQKEFLTVDPLLAISRIRTMDEVVSRSIAAQNFNMVLLTIFGAIALLLAAIGIYGLMSYSVEQETHDIGVRLALGAGRREIVSMVVWRGMRLAAVGLVLGVGAAFGATRVLGRLLFGVRATDPGTYAVVLLALGTVAFLACYLPARRAMAVDPIVALRQE
jgi:predicted permease